MGAAGRAGIGLTLTDLTRANLGFRCIHELRITAAIPTKQSSRIEPNRAGTLKSPLPRYSGDWTSPPMVLASNGRTR